MNWKLRLKNKAILTALIAAAVAFVYQILGIFGVVPTISQEQVINLFGLLLNILVGLGILVDPTTAGIGDSARALQYDEPKAVTTPDIDFPMGGENAGDTEEAHEMNDPDDPEV